MLSLVSVRRSRKQTWSAPKTAATETASRETATMMPPTEATPPVRTGSAAAACDLPQFCTTSLFDFVKLCVQSMAPWLVWDYS